MLVPILPTDQPPPCAGVPNPAIASGVKPLPMLDSVPFHAFAALMSPFAVAAPALASPLPWYTPKLVRFEATCPPLHISAFPAYWAPARLSSPPYRAAVIRFPPLWLAAVSPIDAWGSREFTFVL